MSKYIIPTLFFIAPIVVNYFALQYHKKKEPTVPFAWGFTFATFGIGWLIALGVLLWNLGIIA